MLAGARRWRMPPAHLGTRTGLEMELPVGPVTNRFGRAFHQAVDRAEDIRFSLDGIDDVGAAVRAGRRGFAPGNFTNAELHYIANNPAARAKTTFYRNGQPVRSPFE